MVRYRNAVSVVEMDDSDLCGYGWKIALDEPTTAVRFVRGNKMKTLDMLFDEFSAACQFPYYFGQNYAAFAECLGDLDWLNASRFVLIISKFAELLADEPVELVAFGRSLAAGIDEYNKSRRNAETTESFFRVVVNSVRLDDPGRQQFFAELTLCADGGA